MGTAGVAAVVDAGLTLGALEREAVALWSQLSAERAGAGAVLWLSGEIGAGKTTLVQAIARAAGAEPATSPTFALVHEYDSPAGLLIHVDCYRLRDADEARDLDFRGLLSRARLLIVEWPERAGHHVPTPDVHLTLRHADDPARRVIARTPCH